MNDVLMENVSFQFPQGPKIVTDFSLEVKKGEFLYLFGPNGSGKTTLLRMLCGVIEPMKGKIEILGKDPFKHPEVLKQTGIMIDGMGFYADLSLKENVLLFAREKGVMNGVHEKLNEYIKLWDIDFNTLYKRGSHGMRRIAQLTLALINDPQLIIWDEPELALDEKRQKLLLDVLKEYKSKGKTAIIAGTNPDFYSDLIDRTVKKEVVL